MNAYIYIYVIYIYITHTYIYIKHTHIYIYIKQKVYYNVVSFWQPEFRKARWIEIPGGR